MIYFAAIGLGLLAGALLGFGWGYLAADLYSRSFGAGDGGNAMGGFFTFGPIGFLVGALLASGFVLRSEAPALGRALLWGGGIVFALASILFVMPWWMRLRENSRFAKFNLEMEFSVPIDTETKRCLWGYQGHASEGKADYPFYDERLEGHRKIFLAKMNMSDYPPQRRALFSLDGEMKRFDVPAGGPVNAATDWANWQESGPVRFRWRMH